MSKASRKYEAGVERALGLFDTTNEWADYIAFLSRLHRALQGGPEGADIPFKQTVAKYLAQCLTPALPSGVHQKALEVYTSIFSIIGKDRLGKDLALYLPGVSHTLSFGSLSVRPLFLLLIRDHVLRLPPSALRPALKAILLSLLPGLEDESTEDFETTLATVSETRIIFAREGFEGFFWQSLFLVTITSPNRRPGAFVYLSRHLPKIHYRKSADAGPRNATSAEDPLDLILSPEPGLLIRCFSAGLLDEQILVQRNFLDLLVTHLPIGALAETKRVIPKDVEILVSGAVSVVLRRDMSLNKRLWSWFLGPETQAQTGNGIEPLSPEEALPKTQLVNGHSLSGQSESYFKQYSLGPLIQSLERLVDQESNIPSERARPYRIALSLMDRWEVGGPVVAATFVPLMRSLQSFHGVAAREEEYAEVFRSANVFFDGVESNLIWTQVFQLYQKDEWDLINFVISRFNLEEEEMLVLHLPLFALLMFHKLGRSDSKDSSSSGPNTRQQQIQTILASVLNLIPERAYESQDQHPAQSDGDEEAGIASIEAFYSAQDIAGNAPKPPFSRSLLTALSLKAAATTYKRYLAARLPLIHEYTQAFAVLISKTPSLRVLENLLLPQVEQHLIVEKQPGLRWLQLSTSSMASILVAICTKDKEQFMRPSQVQSFVRLLVPRLWVLMSPSTPQFHVESSQHVLSLHGISEPSRTVESTIVSLLAAEEKPVGQKIDHYAVLWSHAGSQAPISFLLQPLLYVLDMALLQDVCEPARSWVKNLPFSSLEIVYRAMLSGNQEDCITRAVGILNMQTNEQWEALAADTGLNIRQNLSSMLIESLEAAENSQFEHREVLEVLSLLRVLQSHSALIIDEAILTTILASLLQSSFEGSPLQHALIESLQEMTVRRDSPYPPAVLAMLLKGISSTVDGSIDRWMSLTCAVVMLYDADIFQVLLRTTDCFCTRLYNCLTSMQQLFDSTEETTLDSPEKLTVNLLGGLEYILARAHQILGERDRQKTPKSPDVSQGLFGSVVPTSTHATTEEKQLRSSFANDRLTLILCFQDAVKLCYRYWSWGAASHALTVGTQASLYHVASKIRSRSRRILDNLLEAEPQECLETLIALWADAVRKTVPADGKRVLSLLQSLKGGRPRLTLPTTFNAIYNRTNPSALDKYRRSTLSTNLSAIELATFLTEYTASLEDDLVEEIWVDCTTFLREVLGNPMPHRQILLLLLEFIAVLCSKIENTNFGEEYRMRRELGDLCLRLFTAIFTVKPGGLDIGAQGPIDNSPQRLSSPFEARNPLLVLCNTLPLLSHVLKDSDRFVTVLTGIATNFTSPLLKSKNFPQSISFDVLKLLQIMSKPASSNKGWRKDVFDAFNDTRFFSSPISIVRPGWLPLIRQLLVTDKMVLPNILFQLVAPTTAGIMFGVGATAARAEADKRTQTVLRRTALIFVAAEPDTFAGNVSQVHTKIEQLLLATKESSPSSVIRGDIFSLLRAIILTTSPIHLALLWPTIDAELREEFSYLTEINGAPKNTASTRLQAAKLLDLLLLLKPDEFQLHEWLFVTDTVDAIYPPANFVASSLSDVVARNFSREEDYPLPTTFARKLRKPWLCSDMSREVATDETDAMLLQPFFRQLSIHAFEDIYSLSIVDREGCIDDLIADLFSS
jgi:hypothetical protein